MPKLKSHSFHHTHLPLLVPIVGFLLVIVMVGLAAGIALLGGNQDLGSKAAPATTLGLTTSNATVGPGQIFTVKVDINTNANLVKAVDVGLRYDKSYLELIKIEKGAFASQAQELINSVNGAAGIASYSVIVPTNANPPYLTGQGVLATATFKALQKSDSTRVTFSQEDTTVGAQGESTDAVSLHTDLDVKIADVAIIPTPTLVPTNAEFFVYSYEACLNYSSNGSSTYIVWNNTRYPNIKSVDISTKADFSEYANKDVTNPKPLSNGFAMTDGTNFRWYNSSKGAFTFDPEITYYLRLFYDNRHSAITTYKVTKCSGVGGVSYKQCNEACSNNDECATNLYCYNSKCRRINNQDNTSCVLPPDKGIKRSCNEYCSDNSECSDGLTCWYNRCRAPQKTDDQSCSSVTTTTTSCNKYCADSSECSNGLTCWYNRCRNSQSLEDVSCRTIVKPGVVVDCNKSCSTNSDCPANLRCYNDQCRLLTNPANTRCQPPTSSTDDTGTGGYVDDNGDTVRPTRRPTVKPIAKVSPTIVVTSTVSPTPKANVVLNVSPSPKVSAKPSAKPTTVKKLVNDFPDKTEATPAPAKKASSPFAAVPLILGIIIIAVAAVLGVPRILSALQAKSGQSLIANPTPMQPAQPVQPTATRPAAGLNNGPATPTTPATGGQSYGRPISSSTPEQK